MTGGFDRSKSWLVATAFLASSTMVLALGSFEFMLVPMQIDLGLSVDQANATNLIPTAASLLVVFAASSLSDRWGYRRLLISGALVYAIGALLVSLAQGFGMVMVGRALGGAGAVTLGIVGLAAINTSFESPDQRAKAFAAFAALIPAVSFLFPPLGAVISESVNWRFVPLFWLLAGLATAALAWRRLSPGQGVAGRRSELLTPMLSGVFLACLALAATVITSSLSSAVFFAALAAISFLIVRTLIKRRGREGPDLSVLRAPGSRWVLGASLFAFGANFYFFTSLFMQYRYEESVVKMSIMLSAPEAAAILGCFVSGWAAGRWGAPKTATVALALAGLAQLLVFTVGPFAPSIQPALVLTVIALPLGASLGPMTQTLMDLVPEDRSSGPAAVRDSLQNLGSTVGGIFVGTVGFIAFEIHMRAQLAATSMGESQASSVTAAIRDGAIVKDLARQPEIPPDAAALLLGDQAGLRLSQSVTYWAAGAVAAVLLLLAAVCMWLYVRKKPDMAQPRP